MYVKAEIGPFHFFLIPQLDKYRLNTNQVNALQLIRLRANANEITTERQM